MVKSNHGLRKPAATCSAAQRLPRRPALAEDISAPQSPGSPHPWPTPKRCIIVCIQTPARCGARNPGMKSHLPGPPHAANLAQDTIQVHRADQGTARRHPASRMSRVPVRRLATSPHYVLDLPTRRGSPSRSGFNLSRSSGSSSTISRRMGAVCCISQNLRNVDADSSGCRATPRVRIRGHTGFPGRYLGLAPRPSPIPVGAALAARIPSHGPGEASVFPTPGQEHASLIE